MYWSMKFGDTGAPIASSPMHQVMIGEAETKLEEAHIWLRRQLDLETLTPPLQDNAYTGRNWRISKGAICEASFEVATIALKMSGTSQALLDNQIGRSMRDGAMGLVQAFPSVRGKLDYAKQVTTGAGWAGMTTLKK